MPARIIFAIGLDRISMVRGGAEVYYLTDGQGNIRMLTDSAGNVTDSYNFNAFGEAVASTGVTLNDFKYGGEQEDQNTGLYYLRARWMDSKTGRFTSSDPVNGCMNCPLSQNKYLYAEGNPILKSDPSGLSSIFIYIPYFGYLTYVDNVQPYYESQVFANPFYTGCKPHEISDITAGMESAVDMVTRSVKLINSGVTQEYRDWFDANYAENDNSSIYRFNKVKHRWSRLYGDITFSTIQFDCSERDAGFFARENSFGRSDGKYLIYPGKGYWPAKLTGTDSKGGIIIHEMTHEAFESLDVYTEEKAKWLAKEQPNGAIKNADNYEYYAEHAP